METDLIEELTAGNRSGVFRRLGQLSTTLVAILVTLAPIVGAVGVGLLGVGGVAAASTVATTDTSLLDDFEDGDMTEWSVTTDGAEVGTSTTDAHDGSYSLRINDSTGSTPSATRSDGVDNPTTVTYWVKPTSNGAGSPNDPDGSFSLRTESGEAVMRLAADSVGSSSQWSVQTPSGSIDLTSVTLDEWVKIEIRNVDYEANTYDIWIDGTEQRTGVEFASSASKVGQIQFAEYNDYGLSYFDTVNIDNEGLSPGESGLDLVDSMEDGDLQSPDWTTNPDGGTIEASTDYSIDGTHSIRLHDTGTGVSPEALIGNNISDPERVLLWVRPTASDSDAFAFLRNESGTIAFQITNQGGTVGQWSSGGQDLASVTYGEWTKLEFADIDYQNNTFDVHINDKREANDLSFSNDVDGIQELRLWESADAGTTYWDRIEAGTPSSTQTVSGTVVTQNGDPVEGATVIGHATAWDSETIDQNRQRLEDISEAAPQNWTDLDLADDPDLFGDHWTSDATDSYVYTGTSEALPETASWIDNPQLDQEATVALPAEEEIVVSVFDATDTSRLSNGCIVTTNEYDCQVPGSHKADATVVVERIGPAGDVIDTSTHEIDQEAGGGFLDPDSFHYTTLELSTGYYYIHEQGEPRGIPRQVGEPQAILNQYQEDADGQITEHASAVQDAVNQGNLERITATTDANGEYTLDVPTNAKVVMVQAVHAPKIVEHTSVTADSLTYQTVDEEYNSALKVDPRERTVGQAEIANASLYYPSTPRTAEPPASGVDLTLEEVSASRNANMTALMDRLAMLEDLIRNGTFSELPAAIQERLEDLSRERLEELHAELGALVEQNERLRERLTEIDGDGVQDSEDLTNEELREEIQQLEQTLNEIDRTGTIEDPEVDRGNNSISLAWTVPDMDVSSGNVSVIADYTNGTSRVVPEEYIAVDSSLVGDDVVRVEDYPIGEADPAAVQMTLRIAGENELRERKDTVKNPTFPGELPELDSVRLSSAVPGPNENVSLQINPAERGSFKSLGNVTMYGPDGATIATTTPSNNEVSFSTNGAGVYHAEVVMETTAGENVTLPVRFKAASTDMDRPPTVTARDSTVGLYALVSGDLESAEIRTRNAGARTTVLAQVPKGGDVPNEVDVHLEELAIPGTSTTTVRVVQGTSQETVGEHVEVTLHHRGTGDSYLVRAHGKPVTADGATRFGKVRSNADGFVVDTWTEADGTVEVKKINNPSWRQRGAFWIDLQRANIPVLTAAPPPAAPDAIGGVVLDVERGLPLGVVSKTADGVTFAPLAELVELRTGLAVPGPADVLAGDGGVVA